MKTGILPLTNLSEPVPLAWIGDVLIAARKQINLTQRQLAEKIGSYQAAVARWEMGKYQTATLKTILLIARALDLEVKMIPMLVCGTEAT
jgi:transcriptional regulator with XRE-family HTH domain